MEAVVAGSGASVEAGTLRIHSPAKAWLLPLESTPDAAFASGALGPGVTLELLDDLIRAPCPGKIAAIASARHAITIDCGEGTQILIHCGIDTVSLEGGAFQPLVAVGDIVGTGDGLMRVDLEAIVAAGKSAATPIVVVEGVGSSRLVQGAPAGLVDAGTPLFELRPLPGIEPTGAATGLAAEGDPDAVREVRLPLPHGLHARPSAAISAEARRWPGVLFLVAGGRRASAESTVALMKLGVVFDSLVRIEGRGAGAERAVAVIAALIEAGAGDEIERPPEPAEHKQKFVALRKAEFADVAREDGVIGGVAASPGLAIGAAYYFHRSRIDVTECAKSAPVEKARLGEALLELRGRLSGEDKGAVSSIGAAQLAILDDLELIASIEARIDEGEGAAHAWQSIMRIQADALRALPDARLAERADDFVDLEQRLLRILLGKDSEATAPPGSIVIASELYPSDLAPLSKAGVAGIATLAGGPTSHLAILAASAGIPMVVAFGEALCRVEEGQLVFLDGDAGTLRHALDEEQVRKLRRELAQREMSYSAALASAQSEARLASGERIEVFANIGSIEDAEEAVKLGAEGSGLVRTEFLFLERAQPPEEAEQVNIYSAIMDRFGERPVIFRTLDIGADKPAPYLPLDREENPALGVRGIRIGLRYPDLLTGQLRAILRAAGNRTANIMAPMIASLGELERLRTMLDRIVAEIEHSAPVRLGVMIETPASALIAEALARHADFLSVGTNDLTQYTLAADRTNPQLARHLDVLHPAVTRLIDIAAKSCRAGDRMLGVCGGAAGDPLAAAVLVGLGVGELSVSAARVPEIKQWLRAVTLDQCRAAAEAALSADSAEDARKELAKLLSPVRVGEGLP